LILQNSQIHVNTTADFTKAIYSTITKNGICYKYSPAKRFFKYVSGKIKQWRIDTGFNKLFKHIVYPIISQIAIKTFANSPLLSLIKQLLDGKTRYEALLSIMNPLTGMLVKNSLLFLAL